MTPVADDGDSIRANIERIAREEEEGRRLATERGKGSNEEAGSSLLPGSDAGFAEIARNLRSLGKPPGEYGEDPSADRGDEPRYDIYSI